MSKLTGTDHAGDLAAPRWYKDGGSLERLGTLAVAPPARPSDIPGALTDGDERRTADAGEVRQLEEQALVAVLLRLQPSRR